MDSTVIDNLQAPRFQTGKAFLVAGIGERYTWDSGGPAIPGQWQRFHQSVEGIPRRARKVSHGVWWNGDAAGKFVFVTGRQVTGFAPPPHPFPRLPIPYQSHT